MKLIIFVLQVLKITHFVIPSCSRFKIYHAKNDLFDGRNPFKSPFLTTNQLLHRYHCKPMNVKIELLDESIESIEFPWFTYIKPYKLPPKSIEYAFDLSSNKVESKMPFYLH